MPLSLSLFLSLGGKEKGKKSTREFGGAFDYLRRDDVRGEPPQEDPEMDDGGD